MNVQRRAKIFLANERWCNEGAGYRSYHVFNFGEYHNEHKHGFAGIYRLGDDTIAGSYSVSVEAEESVRLLLLPVVGTVGCKINMAKEVFVSPGELRIIDLCKGDTAAFLNGYANELINFIQVWIRPGVTSFSQFNQLFTFELGENKNQLVTIAGYINNGPENLIVSIGKLDERKEAYYKLGSEQNNLFVFVIEGVFEVQGRLLHARDGLGLWSACEEIEIEALSNDAIVLTIELK